MVSDPTTLAVAPGPDLTVADATGADVADGGAGRKAWRALFAFVVLAVTLSRAIHVYSGTIPAGGDPWMAGDWLINYGGGFVRRGLFGELFLRFAPSGEAGLWVLFAIQVACYALILSFFLQVLHRTSFSWSSIALVCGPAGLAFIGWDTLGGFRKELLALVVLTLLAWARAPHRRGPSIVILTSAGMLLWVLAVFSWEPTALLLPAAFYLLLTGAGRPLAIFRRTAAALFAAVGFVGAAVSTLAHGEVGTALLVCRTIRNAEFLGPNLCGADSADGGAVEAIGWTSAQAIADVAASFPLYVGYLPVVALALLPALLSRWTRRNRIWAVAIAVGVLPIYFVVTDYGRWTHVLVIALTLCITAADPRDGYSPMWNPLVAILYVSLWGIPHNLAPDDYWSWRGLVSTVMSASIEFVGDLLGFPNAPGLDRSLDVIP